MAETVTSLNGGHIDEALRQEARDLVVSWSRAQLAINLPQKNCCARIFARRNYSQFRQLRRKKILRAASRKRKICRAEGERRKQL
jgi:hypothetical protein